MRSWTGRNHPTATAPSRPIVRTALTALTVLVAATSAACGTGQGGDSQWQDDFIIPPELRGRWVTRAPRYEDRMLELQTDAVVFYTGGLFGVSAHRIREGRKREGSRAGTLYEIRYRSNAADELYDFSFYYRSENGEEIRFENQPLVVWTRAEETG